MKVEELSRFGKTLTTLPEEALKKQKAIFNREIRTKFGLFGMLLFFIRLLLEQRALKGKYPEAYREALKMGEDAAKELSMLVAMFNIVARKEGRENAYKFVLSLFQKVAIISMPELYQIDDLVKCEGDTFENFGKFNIAWFKAMVEAGTYKVTDFKEEKDEHSFIVTECANVILAKSFDCPEIAKLGCDHDLAGYPVILDRVIAEFRRPHTMAKGDEYCDFHFYRKGTAPDTKHLNK
ncbi:L-2-amino-thiazoline-4-carboxylic acid hydrolase [Chloroflexota bacterium]